MKIAVANSNTTSVKMSGILYESFNEKKLLYISKVFLHSILDSGSRAANGKHSCRGILYQFLCFLSYDPSVL